MKRLSSLLKAVIGPGHVIEDAKPLPVVFRTHAKIGGTQPAVPTGTPGVPGVKASNKPSNFPV